MATDEQSHASSLEEIVTEIDKQCKKEKEKVDKLVTVGMTMRQEVAMMEALVDSLSDVCDMSPTEVGHHLSGRGIESWDDFAIDVERRAQEFGQS